ncbi:MAG: hypothetical protein IT440_07325 [Phycisphaeraceae bacterium]|nr:hypothetical protein [Phycisphaeraceae bacterium]
MIERKRIPTHLIAGPLGVGKTTAIIDYCRRHAGMQYTAILVNDFGPVGLDGAIVEGAGTGSELQVITIPGGCICCDAAVGMMGGLQKLAQDPRVDRIIVEPSGVAMPAMIVDQLRYVVAEHPIDLRPTIVLLDVRQHARVGLWDIPYFQAMIHGADILVANRCDQTTPQAVEKFMQFTAAIYPPKLRIIATHHGQIPDDVFDLTVNPHHEESDVLRPEHVHAHAGGFTLPPAEKFDLDRARTVLDQLLRDGLDGQKIDRLKGIFHTDDGWYLLEIASGNVESRRTEYRRDNRVDWITIDGKLPRGAMKRAFDQARLPA